MILSALDLAAKPDPIALGLASWIWPGSLDLSSHQNNSKTSKNINLK